MGLGVGGARCEKPARGDGPGVRSTYLTAAIVVFVVSLFAFAWGTLEQRQRPGASVGSVAEADMEAMRACGEMEVVSQEKTQCLVDVAMEIGRRGEGRWQSWQQALDTLDAYVVELDFDRRDIGFVYGWTEWYLGQREHYGQEREIYDMLCRPEKNRDLKEDCAHGFVHVAYQQDLGGFEERVEFCDALGGYAIDPEAEIGQCYAGLLMSDGPLPRISKEIAADLCRQASQVAAERCWPWVYWTYPSEEVDLARYEATCAASEHERWCGRGVAMYTLFGSQEASDTTELMRTCGALKSDETALGCAIEALALDAEGWWSNDLDPCDANETRGLCQRARSILAAMPCESDHDIERVDRCLRRT